MLSSCAADELAARHESSQVVSPLQLLMQLTMSTHAWSLPQAAPCAQQDDSMHVSHSGTAPPVDSPQLLPDVHDDPHCVLMQPLVPSHARPSVSPAGYCCAHESSHTVSEQFSTQDSHEEQSLLVKHALHWLAHCDSMQLPQVGSVYVLAEQSAVDEPPVPPLPAFFPPVPINPPVPPVPPTIEPPAPTLVPGSSPCAHATTTEENSTTASRRDHFMTNLS